MTVLLVAALLIFGTGTFVFADMSASVADWGSKTISVTNAVETGSSAAAVSSFIDVAPSSPYYKAIMFLAENGCINGSGNGYFRPDDYITPAEALTILERLYGDPTLLPENWEEWCSPHYSYPAKWFDPVEVKGMYVDSYVSHDRASSWILSMFRMVQLPKNIYSYPNVSTDTSSDAFWTMLVYGYSTQDTTNTLGYECITRGEFCNLVVWAGGIIGSIPEPHFSPSVAVPVLTRGYDSEYMENLSYLYIQDTLFLIPEEILQVFVDNGYMIKVMSKSAYNEYVYDKFGSAFANTTSGLYIHAADTRQGEVIVNSTSADTILHEIGHFVYFNMLDSLADAESLFKNEDELTGVSGCFKSDYCRRNVKEFFAEAFVAYIKMPGLLKMRAPLTYALIDSLI